MNCEILKVLLTAQDPQGREVSLVRLFDGRWGILMEGQCHAVGWPNGELPAAARAYRDLVWARQRAVR